MPGKTGLSRCPAYNNSFSHTEGDIRHTDWPFRFIDDIVSFVRRETVQRKAMHTFAWVDDPIQEYRSQFTGHVSLWKARNQQTRLLNAFNSLAQLCARNVNIPY